MVTAAALVVALAGGVTAWVITSKPSPQPGALPAGGPVMVSVPTVLILDGSGSMNQTDAPGPRIEAAKAAAAALIDALPDDATLGLDTYGTSTGSSPAEHDTGCHDVRTLIPLGALDREAIHASITSLQASGYTPISLALQHAGTQLPADSSEQAIVLVSDGEDTCNSEPCQTAAQLKTSHPNLRISTIGFRTDGPTAEQLRCIATTTGGLFVPATNATQLATRLIATQNLNAANTSLTPTGLGDIQLGQSPADIHSTHPDFPNTTTGDTTITWRDCDYTFTNGTLTTITPHNGGRTIDGLTPGTPLAKAIDLYGQPLGDPQNNSGLIWLTFTADPNQGTAYRIAVDNYSPANTGTITRIVLCHCAPNLTPVTESVIDASLFLVNSDGATGYFFTSPSGRWRCAIRAAEAGCNPGTAIDMPVTGAPLVPSHYDHKPVPPNAIVVIGNSAHFASQGDPHFWRFDQPARILEYGQTISALGFTCNSQETGISCRNDASGVGFTFSTESYRFDYTPVAGGPSAGGTTVVLGGVRDGGAMGYGTERPSVVTLGTCANAISNITWQDWGGPVAHGEGLGCVQMGDPPHYSLVASELGQCHGVIAYRRLEIVGGGATSICDE